MWTVYKHTTPNGKVYIGITSRKPVERWNNGCGYINNPHFYNAIKKYGWGNITHEVLFEALEQNQAFELEQQLIQEYKSYDRQFGYNNDLGGSGFKMTEEQKAKQSQRIKSLWEDEEYKKKQSKAIKNAWTEEKRKAHSGANHPMYGKHYCEEVRKKLKESKKGCRPSDYCLMRSHTPEANKKRADKLKLASMKKVVLITPDGSEIVYSSIKVASEKTGVGRDTISYNCRGMQKARNGFIWQFAENTKWKEILNL